MERSQPYRARYPKGTSITVASRRELEEFRETWRYHHKLEAEQLSYADCTARVISTSYYHGGDVLYQLENIPGYWHECSLKAAD